MPPTQDSKTTFKPNLTWIFLSLRARYIMSKPVGRPCNSVKSMVKISSIFVAFSEKLDFTNIQGLPTGFDIMYLALRDRNIQVRFGLKVVWEFGVVETLRFG